MRGDPRAVLSLLEAAAERLGVQVRYDLLARDDEIASPRSGLCTLMGKKVILVDRTLGPAERCAMIARALGELDLQGIYLPPLVRMAVEDAGGG